MTVTWDSTTQDELARIWLNAKDRAEVSQAANTIDTLLSTSPEAKGEPFLDGRLLVESPLAVTYAIDADNCQVRVLQVWHLERLENEG